MPVERQRRFIPAGAGNAGCSAVLISPTTVHPRGCGERFAVMAMAPQHTGSSPRVRGTLAEVSSQAATERFIPAGAGNATVHRSQTPQGVGSSPRVRGTPWDSKSSMRASRFIPAGAGNAAEDFAHSKLLSVHPRGCGERKGHELLVVGQVGSSPRVRGTHPDSQGRAIEYRFIPAGAGNATGEQLIVADIAVHPRGCGER